MDYLEKVLQSDDSNPGSFGSFEKQATYVLLVAFSVPVILIPFLFEAFKKSIYYVTLFLSLFILGLFLMVHFKFSWIIGASQHLLRLFNK